MSKLYPQGNTALDVVNERLDVAAESSETYDLEEEHIAVRHYLIGEMKKRGWSGEAPVIRERDEEGRERRSVSVSQQSREDVGGGGVVSGGRRGSEGRGGRKLQWRARGSGMTDRTGKCVLLSDDEEDDDNVYFNPKSPNLQKGTSPHCETTSLKPSSSRKLLTSKSLARQGSKESVSKTRQLKRPFAQREDTPPVLIPEYRTDSSVITGAYPIIDHWLEDDVGCRHQTKKRKSRDPFSSSCSVTSSQSTSSTTKGTLSLNNIRGVGSTQSRERVSYSSSGAVAESSGRDEALVTGGDDVVTIDSSPESHPHQEHTFTGHTTRHPTQLPTSHSTTIAAGHRSSTQAPPPPLLPLRIRVKIGAKSYLVPCPAKLTDGSESTIQWLAAQAAERYTQHVLHKLLSIQ